MMTFVTLRGKRQFWLAVILAILCLSLNCFGPETRVQAASSGSLPSASLPPLQPSLSSHLTTPPFVQQYQIGPLNTSSQNSDLGQVVALSNDGNTALIGNSHFHLAYIYVRTNGTTWVQQQMLLPTDDNTFAFGAVIALSGDGNTALLNANINGGTVVYVFVRNGTTWTLQQKLVTPADYTPTNLTSHFGAALALSSDGNTAVIGAPGDSTVIKPGAAYIFVRSGSTWTEKQKFTNSTGPNANYSGFGNSVAISGDSNTLLLNVGTVSTSGAIYAYTHNGNSWTQPQPLTASDPTSYAFFGSSLALSSDGHTALVGANGDGTTRPGGTYVFARSGNTWSQQQKLSVNGQGYNSHNSVALSGNGSLALIGSGTGSDMQASVFERNGSSWSLRQTLPDTNVQSVATNSDGGTLLMGKIAVYGAVEYVGGVAEIYVRQGIHFRVTAPLSSAPGTHFSVTVTVLDGSGNLYPAYRGTLHFSSSDTPPVFPADYTFTAADNGTHTFVNEFASQGQYFPSIFVQDTVNAAIRGQANIFGQSSNIYTYYLPFLANSAGGFTTYLAVQNVGTSSARYLINYYDSSGATYTPSLNAPDINCAYQLSVEAECLPGNGYGYGESGTGIIVSDQPLNVIVAESTTIGGSAYTVSAGGNNTLSVPFALRNAYGDYSTILNVFNGDVNGVLATVTFYDQNGNLQANATQTINLAPRTSTLLDQSLDSSNLPDGFDGWAQITSPAGSSLTAQVLEQSQSQRFAAIASAQSQAHSTLYAPAIFKGAFGFTTGANIINPGPDPVTVTVNYYQNDGTSYPAAPFVLAPHALNPIYQGATSGIGLPAGGLPNGFVGAASVSTTGGGSILLAVNENGGSSAGGTTLSGTYAGAASGKANVSLPVVSNGGFGYITGLTILNTSPGPVSGTIQYYNLDGTSQGSAQMFNIGPQASQLAYQGAPGTLPASFYGTAVVSESSGSDLIVTTNVQSAATFYTYTLPNQ